MYDTCLRDPSTTGSESSIYWSWVVPRKKKKKTKQHYPFRGSYSATWNNMEFVHWLLMGGLLHLVQRGGAWTGRPHGQLYQSPYCCMVVRCSAVLMSPLKGLILLSRSFDCWWQLYWIGPYIGSTVGSLVYQFSEFIKDHIERHRPQDDNTELRMWCCYVVIPFSHM